MSFNGILDCICADTKRRESNLVAMPHPAPKLGIAPKLGTANKQGTDAKEKKKHLGPFVTGRKEWRLERKLGGSWA